MLETLARVSDGLRSRMLPARVGHRAADRRWLAYVLLFLLAVVLMITNPWFALIDDEAYQVGSAAQPMGIVATQFKTHAAQLHLPLPDIILHCWLVLTQNSLLLLRVPSILFFVLGIWVCSRIAKEVAGAAAAEATVILGLLWPYGFHFGRYAVWLPLCFFLLACVTYTYLRWLEQPTARHLSWFVIVALALLYTNFMGWAFLAMLGVDFLCRRELHSPVHCSQIAVALGILVVCYAPVWPEFVQLFKDRGPAVPATAFFTFLYSVYVLFASESIAPWVVGLSVPLMLCIIGCGVVIQLKAARFARMLCAFVIVLALALALSGEINQKRVMPLGVWLLTSAGIAFATVPPRWRRWLIIGFTCMASICWFGIISRRFYSTTRSFEPWQQISHLAAISALSGETVIGNHPAFLFYLTHELMKAEGLQTRHFKGNYGEQVRRRGIYHVTEWTAAGHPTSPRVLFVAALYGTDFESTTDGAAWLDQYCARERTERFVENPKYELKRNVFGPAQGSQWRIEVRRYACNHQSNVPGP